MLPTYTYDAAHRLTRISDAQNNALVYTLDNAGNHAPNNSSTRRATSSEHSRVFDA